MSGDVAARLKRETITLAGRGSGLELGLAKLVIEVLSFNNSQLRSNMMSLRLWSRCWRWSS
jgi:hypothetical protein